MTDELVDQIALIGDEAECQNLIREYAAGGIHTHVMAPMIPDPQMIENSCDGLQPNTGQINGLAIYRSSAMEPMLPLTYVAKDSARRAARWISEASLGHTERSYTDARPFCQYRPQWIIAHHLSMGSDTTLV